MSDPEVEDSVPDPSEVVPFIKVTEPDGVPGADDVTVAVRMTGWPVATVVEEAASVVIEAAVVTVRVPGTTVAL